MIIRVKMDHNNNCKGNCGYCQYLNKKERVVTKEVLFTWDEVSMLI